MMNSGIEFIQPGRRSEASIKTLVSGAGSEVLTAFESETGRDVSADGEKLDRLPEYNDIGVMGTQDACIGICPTGFLPAGMTLLPGTETPGHDNWGNYQFREGSILCYIPAHWIKIGTGANGLAVNVFSIVKYSTYADETTANAAGYFLPRCFKDGGETKLGYFIDKYECSKNAYGTGYVASSIKNGLPLSTAATHNPIADLTACAGNYYYEAINAAHARDGVDGAVNADSNWFCASKFIYVDLAMLSMAHGQAATSTTYCAWYDATGATNYPKGCNNNALGDTDDGTILYTSDGYQNCGKTGSGTPFAKTTHNGQNCGVADLNGNMYEISTGVTCIATTPAIEAMSQASPCEITITGHGKDTGDFVQINSITQADWVGAKDKIFTLTKTGDNTFTIPFDASGFGTAYDAGTDPGTATIGKFYVVNEATAMKDFTSGNTLSTDHWGATGVAAMMSEFTPVFETAYPNDGFTQRMGSGANQVLSEAVDGNGAILRSLGMPKDADGVDVTGTNQFGKDYFYQYIRNELCVLSGGGWNTTSGAGVWLSAWSYYRTLSATYVSFRCSCYPV